MSSELRELEERFRNLVSFKVTYQSRSEKELRDIFKAMFAKDDEGNQKFFDDCSYDELVDLCMCFELYISFAHKISYKDIGIAKLTSSHREFFVLTKTRPAVNFYNDEIVGVTDEAAMVFHITGATRAEKKARFYSSFSVLTKPGRVNDDDIECRYSEVMVECMNSETDLQLEEYNVRICKSGLRILSDMYSKTCAYLETANTDFVNGRQSEELMDLIFKLKRRKNDLQLKLHQMVYEIESAYRDEKPDLDSFIDRLDEDAKRLLKSTHIAGKSHKAVDVCKPEENSAAQSKRSEIEVTGLGE